MTEAEAKEAAGTLEMMAEAERAIARLYEACAAADPEHDDVWKRIAASERDHAAAVEGMIQRLLKLQGDGFRVGRKFSTDAIRAFIEQARKSEADVRSGELKGRVLYIMTRGLETAIVEDRFYEFLSTKDEEFHKLVDRIVAETRQHQALMHAWASAARG